MNNQEMRVKVHSAMYTLVKDKGVASPADVLMAIGVLSKADYENWRFGRVHYLERVCKINLHKLSSINHEIRAYAKKHNLKPSWTDYRKWGKGENTRLRFSKSGDDQIERFYATHYVGQKKIEESRERKARKKDTGDEQPYQLNNPVHHAPCAPFTGTRWGVFLCPKSKRRT
jgi:hypothetical protein